LVLLDYTDGRAAIEDNAQVLKALIQQVNQMKTGNGQSVVIGESMSGLVARWALRQMENEGISHQVKLMICYDTPHQGANVPGGLTQLLWEAKPKFIYSGHIKILCKRMA
jgi:triacylglycerol esterase/lipase EstA (alpha/beta hydrolase family)